MVRRNRDIGRITLSPSDTTGSHNLQSLAELEHASQADEEEIDLGPVTAEMEAQESRPAYRPRPTTKETPAVSGPLGRKKAVTQVDMPVFETPSSKRDDPTLIDIPLEGYNSTNGFHPEGTDTIIDPEAAEPLDERLSRSALAHDTRDQLNPYSTLDGIRAVERSSQKTKPIFKLPAGHAIYPFPEGRSLTASLTYTGGVYSRACEDVIDLAARLNTPSDHDAYSTLDIPGAKGVLAMGFTPGNNTDLENTDRFSLNFFRLEKERFAAQEEKELIPLLQVCRASAKRNSIINIGEKTQMYLFVEAANSPRGDLEHTLWLVDDTPDGCTVTYPLPGPRSPEAIMAIEWLGQKAYDELREMFLRGKQPQDDIYSPGLIDSFMKPIARDKSKTPYAAAYLANYFIIGMRIDPGFAQARNLRSKVILTEFRDYLQKTCGAKSNFSLPSRINYTLQDELMGYNQYDDDFHFRKIPLMRLGNTPKTVEVRFGEMIHPSVLTNGKKLDYANRMMLQYKP